MPSAITGVDYKYYFGAKDFNGDPAPGIDLGDFVVTIRNPQNTASDTPAVVEADGGLYAFTIPAAFSAAHGSGSYGAIFSVNSASPAVRDTDSVTVDFDAKLAEIYRYLGIEDGTPSVHTPTSIVAGDVAQTILIEASTITKTRD